MEGEERGRERRKRKGRKRVKRGREKGCLLRMEVWLRPGTQLSPMENLSLALTLSSNHNHGGPEKDASFILAKTEIDIVNFAHIIICFVKQPGKV